MNTILDDMLSLAKKATDFAGEKTSEAISFSQRKIEQTQLESKINDAYKSIGKLHVASIKSKVKNKDEIKKLIAYIDNLKVQLYNLQEDSTQKTDGEFETETREPVSK